MALMGPQTYFSEVSNAPQAAYRNLELGPQLLPTWWMHPGAAPGVWLPGPQLVDTAPWPHTTSWRHAPCNPAASVDAACPDHFEPVSEQDGSDEAVSDDEASQARKIKDQLLEQLRIGGHERQLAIDNFQQLVLKSKVCSLAAQMIVAEASKNDAEALVSGLHGRVRFAVYDKYGNFVLQKIMEVMQVAWVIFVAEELLGIGADVARHRIGCRVLCRILEHGSFADRTTAQLLDEVLDKADDLCRHEYASYVMRHFLTHGSENHRRRTVDVLCKDLIRYSKDKRGSHVVEAALLCSKSEQLLIAERLLSNRDQLLSVATSQFGRHVVKALLSMPGELSQRTRAALEPFAKSIQKSRYAKGMLNPSRAALH